jgi:hypothetical protein
MDDRRDIRPGLRRRQEDEAKVTRYRRPLPASRQGGVLDALYGRRPTDNMDEGRAILQSRLGELDAGSAIGPPAQRVTVAELAPLLVADYEAKGNRSVGKKH